MREKAAVEEQKKQEKVDENEAFWNKLQESEDLNDNLTELANYVHKNVSGTGVYIGKLEPAMRKIEDDDNDAAHIDPEAPLVLKFKHANDDH